MIENIENIELQFLTLDDYKELKEVMIEAYSNMPDSYWKESHIESLIDKFPEGQVVIKINDELAGCALSIIVDYNKFDEHHTYKELTGTYTFDTHNDKGDVLYGIPYHICPTVNLYDDVSVISNGKKIDTWEISARKRKLTI